VDSSIFDNLDGLLIEPLPSGKRRIRVRVKGDPKTRITLPDGLSNEEFLNAYNAARDGLTCLYRPSAIDALKTRPGFMATIFQMLSIAKLRANRKGWQFALVPSDILGILERQDGRCAISGMMFDINPRPRSGAKRPFCMSIDRLKNSAGYTPENVRITTVIANMSLLNWDVNDFRKMCVAVSKCPALDFEDKKWDTHILQHIDFKDEITHERD